jgi:hypothetical protein
MTYEARRGVKIHACKLGTMPHAVIFRHNYKLAVGKEILVRDPMHGSKWYRITIDRINQDGYFFASR